MKIPAIDSTAIEGQARPKSDPPTGMRVHFGAHKRLPFITAIHGWGTLSCDLGCLKNLEFFETRTSCPGGSKESAACRAAPCLGKVSHRESSQAGAGRGFLRHNGRVRHLGYTRVSTSGKDAKLQLDALVDAGVQKRDVFADVTSGSKAAIERPGMRATDPAAKCPRDPP